jgi:1-acyl-sn-glycerol-3-phosphate acyltransferase
MINKLFRLLYQPYKWLFFLPLVVVLTAFFGSLTVLTASLVGPRAASHCGVAWARLLSWATPILVTVRGREHLRPGQSYVVVSNHQSQYDILLLYGWLGVDFKWVMKQDLRRVPFLGFACEKIGHIFIDRANHAAAMASLEAAKGKIRGGTSVVFFPEGTRSRSGELGRFKKGAFRMAIDLGLPVLPVSILGTRAILPTRSLDIFPGRACLLIHPPIETAAYDESSLPLLSEKTVAVIRDGLSRTCHKA